MQTTTIVSPFRIVLCFIALVITGWLILPKLNVDLLPKEKSPIFVIPFSLNSSSPTIVEQQVTSILEGACSQLSQLKKINSVSNYNGGYVQLQFDKSVDVQFKQFELAAIIRQVYPKLPPSASYPVIIGGSNEREKQNALLTYSINAPLQPFRIKQETEAVFRKAFAGMPGIKEVKVSGAENIQLTIRFDKDKCTSWHIAPEKIIGSIQSYFTPAYPGKLVTAKGEQYFLQLSSPISSVKGIEEIVLKVIDGKPVYLKDIAQVYFEEQEPNSYFHINGNNSVSLSLYARDGENKIMLGKKVKELVNKVKKQLQKHFEIRLDYDDTEHLEKEINKNYQRIGLSACILLIFILLAYRSWRHLLNLFSSLLVSLCLTIVFAWLFGVDIHLYTIAGLAISFGIMTDNTIVMLDYYRQWRNRKMFLALLCANLTTIAALLLVFFLPEEEKRNLIDFSIIIILALLSSLITALWFTPGLYELTTKSSRTLSLKSAKKRKSYLFKMVRIQKLSPLFNKIKSRNIYFLTIQFIANYRKIFTALVILGFGVPIFMLPAKWDGSNWYNRWYNASLGSEYYLKKIKPTTDNFLGGTLRLFVNSVHERSGYRSVEKTKLYVSAELPHGNSADQMNYILTGFEKYLSTIEGIDKYVTNIYNGQQGSIEITFKEDYTNSLLPYQLKSKLIKRSLDWGGVDWNIHGVGQGFSNEANDKIPNFRVIMKGYNYDELEKQANKLAEKLGMYKRIQKINTNERLNYDEKKSNEYVLNLDASQMALHNTSKFELLNKLTGLAKPTGVSAQVTINNHYYPVVLKEKESGNFSSYNLLHQVIQLDTDRAIRLNTFGKLEYKNTSNSIHKEDRQYKRVVGFEYLGDSEFGRKFLDDFLNVVNQEMPVGYSVEKSYKNWERGGDNRKYILILLLLLANFFICSILFENLKESFFIICMTPISFIGLFIIFSLGDFYFDQGGYAAFVMLGGLVSNASIFIVNDFNNLKKNQPALLHNTFLIQATTNRARTILLTTISTCCSLIPFLVEGQSEVFWFSLAVGTIAGLLFSLFAVFIVLPVLLWKKELPTP